MHRCNIRVCLAAYIYRATNIHILPTSRVAFTRLFVSKSYHVDLCMVISGYLCVSGATHSLTCSLLSTWYLPVLHAQACRTRDASLRIILTHAIHSMLYMCKHICTRSRKIRASHPTDTHRVHGNYDACSVLSQEKYVHISAPTGG